MGEVELAADVAINVGPIAVSEVKKVVHLLKRGKAAGLDEISLKLLKHGGPALKIALTRLLNGTNCDEAEAIAADRQQWKALAARCSARCRRN